MEPRETIWPIYFLADESMSKVLLTRQMSRLEGNQ